MLAMCLSSSLSSYLSVPKPVRPSRQLWCNSQSATQLDSVLRDVEPPIPRCERWASCSGPSWCPAGQTHPPSRSSTLARSRLRSGLTMPTD